MVIRLVNESNFQEALAVYTASWRCSHSDICTPEFLENRDFAGYLRNKIGCLYLVYEAVPVGVFCLSGKDFGDLYIHPAHQRKGYGMACVRFAMNQSPRLRLTVLSTNTAAIHLYEKSGFRFTGNDIPLRDGMLEREMIRNNEHR